MFCAQIQVMIPCHFPKKIIKRNEVYYIDTPNSYFFGHKMMSSFACCVFFFSRKIPEQLSSLFSKRQSAQSPSANTHELLLKLLISKCSSNSYPAGHSTYQLYTSISNCNIWLTTLEFSAAHHEFVLFISVEHGMSISHQDSIASPRRRARLCSIARRSRRRQIKSVSLSQQTNK